MGPRRFERPTSSLSDAHENLPKVQESTVITAY
jgi:hypothetical protein